MTDVLDVTPGARAQAAVSVSARDRLPAVVRFLPDGPWVCLHKRLKFKTFIEFLLHA